MDFVDNRSLRLPKEDQLKVFMTAKDILDRDGWHRGALHTYKHIHIPCCTLDCDQKYSFGFELEGVPMEEREMVGHCIIGALDVALVEQGHQPAESLSGKLEDLAYNRVANFMGIETEKLWRTNDARADGAVYPGVGAGREAAERFVEEHINALGN